MKTDGQHEIVGRLRYTEETWTGKEWIKTYTFCGLDAEVMAFILANANFSDYRKTALMIDENRG